MNISHENKIWKFPLYEVGEPLDWELLAQKYAWIADMKGVEQDPIWHSEGDVFTHTKMVVEALLGLEEYQALDEQKKHIVFTATLCHDIEKRSTTTREMIDGKERVVSPRHAKKGEHTLRAILYRDISTPFEIREQIVKLVRYHGLPLYVLEDEKPERRVIKTSLMLDNTLLYLLAKADILGRESEDREELLLKVELFKELCLEYNCLTKAREFESNYARFLYLTRDDIALGYTPYDDLEFTVYVMSALPGSGKDSYIEKHLDMPMLSLDAIRREHKIKPTDKKGTGRVIQLAKEQAKVYMRKKQSFVFNATNITKDMRARWISLFLDYRARVEIIYIEVPYKTLKKQNREREYSVPEDVIDKLLFKLEIPCFDEGHEVFWVG